jgi:hypothetical protein
MLQKQEEPKQLHFTIIGTSPLLMNKFTGEVLTTSMKNATPAERAERGAYRSTSGELVIPNANFFRGLVAAGTNTLAGGKGKKTLQKVIAAVVYLIEPELPLGTKEYVISSMGVVVPATGGRIMCHRARIDKWSASGTLSYLESSISKEQLQKVLGDFGSMIGLMDFRPEKKGPYGRFVVEFNGHKS